jgi:hypothetical protein
MHKGQCWNITCDTWSENHLICCQGRLVRKTYPRKKKSSSLIHFSQVSTCIIEIQTKGRLKNGAKIRKVQTNEKTTQIFFKNLTDIKCECNSLVCH